MNTLPFKRICLYAGPGAGKSTMAHWLMWYAKQAGYDMEYCREWVKRWAYAGRTQDALLDQSVILGRQIEEETAAINTGCTVVTDSPILLQAAYAPTAAEKAHIFMVARELDKRYRSLNIFILRGDREFTQNGRWQTSEQAVEKDRQIQMLLQVNNIPFVSIPYYDYDRLWSLAQMK